MRNLLRLIQQRKIDRIAAAYGVAAWILVQAASIALPTFDAPTWMLKALILTSVVAFPLTLWVAWHLQAASASHRDKTHSQTATDVALLIGLALAIFLTTTELVSESGLFHINVTDMSNTGVGNNTAFSEAPIASIAVLPFINLSGDPTKEYFSDGISEELLNQLANIKELRVAARTSSFSFKGRSLDIQAIAHVLKVRAVLEGSVREDGHLIRITAQLIDASNGYHMWSKTYDRDLSNILAVQDEIARSITEALTHGLLIKAPSLPHARSQISPVAYRRYLGAKALALLKTSDGDLRAISIFKQVIKDLPNFAPAYAALGRTTLHLAQFDNNAPKLMSAAESTLANALKLDPRNLEALSAHLQLELMQWRWASAMNDAKKLNLINPHSVFTLRGLNSYYAAMGFPEQQSAALREATRLDPLSFVDLNNLAAAYNNRAQYAEASSAALDALSLRPNRPLSLYTLCAAYAGLKQLKDADVLVEKLASLNEIDAAQGCKLKALAAQGRASDALEVAARLAKRFPVFVFNETDLGNFFLQAGAPSQAFQWYHRAYAKHATDLLPLTFFVSTPLALSKSPAWIELVNRPEARSWRIVRDRLASELASQ